MASSTFSVFSTTAPPAGAGTARAPGSTRMYQRKESRAVVAGIRRRMYKGTARKEAALADLIERKVAEATEACAGKSEEGCRVAWDEVEEVSSAKADLRRRIAEGAHDPLEHFCEHNPLADDCAVVYGD
uniref:Uncharacterized protein n=2 Tax=Avena sativa TaxID=4498 RepID=A0ACD6AM39_AVESA